MSQTGFLGMWECGKGAQNCDDFPFHRHYEFAAVYTRCSIAHMRTHRSTVIPRRCHRRYRFAIPLLWTPGSGSGTLDSDEDPNPILNLDRRRRRKNPE